MTLAETLVCPSCETPLAPGELQGCEYAPDHPAYYDGISEWRCGRCGYREGRWSGRVLTGNEHEPLPPQKSVTLEELLEYPQLLARARPYVPVPQPVALALTGDLEVDVRALTGLSVEELEELFREQDRAEILAGLSTIALTLVGALGPIGVRTWLHAPARWEAIKNGDIKKAVERARKYQ